MQRNVDEAQRERRTCRGLLQLRQNRRECTVELRPEALNGRDNSNRDTGSVMPNSMAVAAFVFQKGIEPSAHLRPVAQPGITRLLQRSQKIAQ